MKLYHILLMLVALSTAILCDNSHICAEESGLAWESKYTNEPYLMLYKERVIRINKDYTATETFSKRALIQTEEGKSLGELKLPYDQGREEIKDIDAYTIASDGSRQRYTKIQDLNDTPANPAVYSDNRKIIITMPGVAKGSIIEWKGTRVYKTPLMENNFYDHFHFTYEAYPIKENVCKVIAPKGMKLHFKNLNTALQPKVEHKGDEVLYTWISKDNDKVELEEFMPPKENVNEIVFISTVDDWNILSDWLWSLFRRNIEITPGQKQKVQELTGSRVNTGEKVQAIIEYIQNEFRYVSMNMDSHNFEPHAASEVYANKYGDCKDLAALGIAMLAEIGVKARPVFSSNIIELRRDDLLPMPFYFDHVFLVYEIDGKQQFTDLLLKGYRFDEIPAALSGKKVFVADDRGGFFSRVPLTDDSEVSNTVSQTVTISDDGTSLVDLEITLSNSVSVGMRQLLKSVNDGTKEKLFAGIEVPLAAGGKVTGRTWGNLEVPFSRISLKMQLEHPNWVERMGDMMTFGSGQVQRKAGFSAPRRKNPIIFSSTERAETISTYILPAGYEVMKLPRNVSIKTPFADFERNYAIEKGNVLERQTFGNKPVELPVTEYETVRNFFNELPKQTAEKVIIRKVDKVSDVKP